MSIEIYVLSDIKLADIADWQRAIDREGFPLRLSDETAFVTQHGFLPAALKGARSGFECDHWDVSDLMEDDVDFGRSWTCALAFRCLGRQDEVQASWMAATAYARATNGVVFDPQEGRLYTPSEGADIARSLEKGFVIDAEFEAKLLDGMRKRGLIP